MSLTGYQPTQIDITDEDRQMFDKCVSRGAAWLDNEVPNWATKVELANFSFADYQNCILGQLNLTDKFDSEFETSHGFDLSDDFGDPLDEYSQARNAAWRFLDYAWRFEIGIRQDEVNKGGLAIG